ncbi:MAG: ABC transporter ATP-binding protein [Planctomycetota bacterium]|nr:ABC transporter ATP-binding protein [Planctomycetota bacterium]
MSAAQAGIVLDRISKWYGEVMALNEVSAEFGPGVTGLLGPNGAGKSTLIKLICGMLQPNLGQVLVNGKTPFNRPSVMTRVGLCPEQDALYPQTSAWNALTYLTRLQGFSARDARMGARRALERVGLENDLGRSVAGYSKGMRQRFKLAQALAHDPDVIILDEPLNGLDPPGRRTFSELIRALGAEGKCLLVSSHILHEVESVARRIVVLNFGRVLADGTSRELRRELPEFPLTVRLTTSEPAELARHIVAIDGARRVEHVDGGLEVLTHHPAEFFDAVSELATSGTVPIEAVTPMDEDLEAVFRYLTQ